MKLRTSWISIRSVFQNLVEANEIGPTEIGWTRLLRRRASAGRRRTRPYLPNFESLERRECPAAGMVVVGPDQGSAPRVKVLDAQTGAERLNFLAYENSFVGGVRVAMADVTGDGVLDIVTGPGPGGGSRVRVFDGNTGKALKGKLGSFNAYATGQTNGVWIAAGDVNGDGRADIVAGTNDGFAPKVKVFSGTDGSLLRSFTISSMDNTSGVRVAAGDVNGDGCADIIAAAGAGSRSRVCVFDGASGGELQNFFAYDQGFLGGVYVAAGDLSGDGLADIITGPGAGHAPLVRVFRGSDTASLDNFLAADWAFTGGVRVAAFDVNGDSYADIAAGAGPGAGTVRWFDGLTKSPLGQAVPYGAGFSKGVFVGGNAVIPPQFTTLSGTNTVTFSDSSSVAAEMGFAVVSVQLTRENSDTVTVDYATASGTATSGVDFTSTSGTLTFTNGGPTLVTIEIPITSDTFDEYNEAFTITLSNISGGTLGSPSVHTVTINDDDEPPGPVDGCLDGSCYTGLLGRPTNPIAQPQPTLGSPRPETSEGPVRYFDGTVRLQQTDLFSDGFGVPWGITRSWSNHQAYGLNSLGPNNTAIAELPYLQKISSSIAVIFNGLEARYFDYNLITYLPRHFLTDSLDEDTGNKEFTFTDSIGNRIVFHNFDMMLDVNLHGQFKSFTDPAGNAISVTAWTSNRPQTIQRSGTFDSVTTTETYEFTYVGSGVNAGQIASIELKRQVGGGSATTIRKVEYTYYDGTEANGLATDLKFAVIKDSASNVIDTWYYRYYTSNGTNGFESGLRYVFSPRSYDRLKAVYSDPAAASDAQVAPYADLYLEYDSQRRVTKEIVQGDGACCGGAGGLGEYTFSYSMSSFANGYNNWARKTVETLPDGNQHIVYTNFTGQVMLKVFKNTATSEQWITYFQYGGVGRLQWSVNPSAVTGYDDTMPGLVSSTQLRDNEGLIEVRTYATTTTATSSTGGSVFGQLEKIELKRGENGAAVKQAQIEYFTRSAFSKTFIIPANTTVYRNSDGTGGETTSYTYTWHGSTAGVESMTVTLPTVTTAQNGPNSADTNTTYFDAWGNPIWHKDGDGFLHYAAYDMGTGAVTKSIVDVQTTQTSDFTALPSGWSTPSGGGLHLKTTIEVDDLGRATKVTSPGGTIDYAVYKDTNHEARFYAGWDTTNNVPTGPTTVVREDRAGGYYETLTMSATAAHSGGRPTGTESIANLETLARSYTNTAWQVTNVDEYFNLSGLTYSTSTSLGTLNTHFYRTSFNYDSRGRLYKTTTPTGTIYQTDFDALGRPSADKVGTSDANLVQTAGYVYDAAGIGDSNLTEVTQYPGGGAANRVSKLYYDWRNRLVAAKSGHEASESTSLNRPIYYFEFDNLSQTIAVEQYDGDNVTITTTNGVPDKPSSSLLRARSTAAFDEQGRVYRMNTFSVNQSDGTVSSTSLQSDIWYGRRGQVLKTSAPGGLVGKAEYDGAGRVKKSFVTDGGGDTAWTDADDVTGDKVLEHVETTYDANSNPIFVTIRQRFHDETATGALADPSTAPKARVSYAAAYYDLADRPTASVNVGTNGGSAYTRPSSVPSRSDTVLVSSQTYNSAGWVDKVTDPRGIEDRFYYDNLGRTTKTIEAYADGTPDTNSDRTNEFTYDGVGHTLTLKAHLTSGAYQKTEFVYGVTTTNSNLNSNDLLAEVKHPDKSSGDPSTSEKDIFTYNALGEAKTSQDRNGNVHTYSFDVVGRLTTDAVTTLGTNVDGAVRRAEVAYDTGGRAYLFTNYDAASAGNIVNQVQRDFNGLGQLTKEYQSHSGAVNTGTSPKVQYAYSEMSGGANHSRPTSMTYPNSRVIDYIYGSGLDSSISRLTSLSDNSTTLESLDYLGLGMVVRRAHPQPGVDLTYIKQGGESNGDAGDQYASLDRFGRVVDQRWRKTSDGSHTDRFKYGYDRNSNRLYRENVVNAAFSELYHADGASNGYDSLDQLQEFQRGTLSDTNSDNVPDTVSTASRSQVWTLDAQGNWSSLNTDGSSVSRTHNKQNQVTVVGSANLSFDSNGNLTTDQNGQQYVFDAWNRLVTVKDSGNNTLASYKFDALGRRVQQTVSNTTTDFYFSVGWQVLEERVGSDIKTQYVWSPVYVDAMVLRDRDADGNQGNGLEERLYVQQDANFNVTAVINTSGAVVERYIYDPYGSVSFLSAGWTGPADAYAWRYLHQGGKLESATGLYHFRNREFHPTLGRWIQVDPLGFAAGDTNLYRYVGNNATNNLDPSGLRRLTPQERLDLMNQLGQAYAVLQQPNASPLAIQIAQGQIASIQAQFDAHNAAVANSVAQGQALTGPRPPANTGPWTQATAAPSASTTAPSAQPPAPQLGFSAQQLQQQAQQHQQNWWQHDPELHSLNLTPAVIAQAQQHMQQMQTAAAVASLLPGPQGIFGAAVSVGLSASEGNPAGIAMAAVPFMRLRPFRQLLAHYNANPNAWQTISAHVERATRRGARQAGASTQILYRNRTTGETMWRHIVTDDAGAVVDDHFRPCYNPRPGDLAP